MQFLSTLLLLLSAAVLLSSSPSEAALLPRASPVPNCYACPRFDNRGNALVTQDDDGNSNKFHCTYVGGQTCQYNKSDGTESGNDPQDRCPDNAIYVCGGKTSQVKGKKSNRRGGVPTRRQPEPPVRKATIEERVVEVFQRIRDL